MILITGTVEVEEDKRAEFLKAAERQVRSSLREEGCLDYGCFEDAWRRNRFTFVERWRDSAAVQVHFAKDYSREFMAAMRALVSKSTGVEIHEVASTRVLPG
ncbi:MAG TPA: putative quinol monooxygenase [Hyphomonadaceae bacterium]|nr:putative quinol monooxygenase [Hyphomonadaceae bacterium]